MNPSNIPNFTTADQAREYAIAWQSWACEQTLFMSEILEWENVFTSLVNQFPELEEESRENGII